ncbi:MAG: RNA polymerase sigma factor, partial [Bryobacteraceae bacterium]
VLQRSVLDYRTAKWGKWRPSAQARRQGPKAVALERLISRDGVPAHVAAAQLGASAPELPSRPVELRRRLSEPVELTADIAAPPETSPDEGVLSAERSVTARAVTRALARTLAGIPRSDRQLLWLRYSAKLSVAQIAKRLGEDQRALYRKFERLHAAVRRRLESSGITRAELAGVIGAADVAVQGVFTPAKTEYGSAQTTQRLSVNASEGSWPLASCH